MNEPVDPGTPPPLPPLPTRPFEATPRATPGGCGTPLLVGCGILTVVLAIAVVVFLVKATSILAFAMEKLERQVVENLPADVSDEERARLEAGFDAARSRIRSGRLDPDRLQSLQALLVDAAGKAGSGKLVRDDVVALTASLEEFAAAEPEGEAPRPRPAPPAAATAAPDV